MYMSEIRNIAIIAHVDHGKTTMIDSIFRQSGTFRENQAVDERAMDSNELEKERGITILAKCTAIDWEGVKINIIDTPGHADFGGEVERVLSMVDGVLLLVDSSEGPMPQTKFVLSKALALGLKPIVVINKADKPEARCDGVLDEVFDLFVSLDANEDQLDFPVLYASGRDGWCVKELGDEKENLHPLLRVIVEYVSKPDCDSKGEFKMLATLLGADPFLGRILTGRVVSGTATVNASVKSINLDGEEVERARLTKLFTFSGLDRVPTDSVEAGDIITIAGLQKTNVADTICDTSVAEAVATTKIDPPTMAVTIAVNDSPLAGQEGDKVTSTMIRDRLKAEAETNVAITLSESSGKDAFEVGGRGELQLGVLIETMRREGFELSVSRPRVLFQKDENGKTLEPIEEVVIDVDDEFSSAVVDALNKRKGEMQDMRTSSSGKTRLIYHVPARGLIGFQGDFLTMTRGTGVLNRLFAAYEPFKGELLNRRNGVLISIYQGEVAAYSLVTLQDRGIIFVEPNEQVYTGMIVGEHNRENDLEVNVLKAKQLTNFRASGKDEAVRVIKAKKRTLEELMSYIGEDELVEVTPKNLRLRKIYLDSNDRKKLGRKKP